MCFNHVRGQTDRPWTQPLCVQDKHEHLSQNNCQSIIVIVTYKVLKHKKEYWTHMESACLLRMGVQVPSDVITNKRSVTNELAQITTINGEMHGCNNPRYSLLH